MARFGSLSARLTCIFFWLCFAPPLLAAEPVEVVVAGIEGDALANVREALTLPYGLVREGKVDRLWLERFASQAEQKVRTALEPFGYYNARVSATLEPAGEGGYRLQVRVAPGEPVRVAEAKVKLRGPGAGEEPLRTLAEAFPLRQGDVLLQQLYEQAKAGLKSRAQELGYLDAEFAVHEIRIAREANSARIELVLESGEQYRFDEVRIEGAADYPDRFLRRYLAFRPGEVFSHARLGETQLSFANSERFREVIVTPEKEEARQLRVPVLVQLKTAPRRRLRPGVGYGTDTGARFTTRYRDLNMFQRGQELDVNFYLSERLQGLATSYTIPSSRDIKSSTGVQLNLQQEDVTSYVSRLIAVELTRNRSFGAGELGTAYLRGQQEEFIIGAEKSSSLLILPGLRFSSNRYDNVIRPGRGYRFAFDLRGTHQLLGSEIGLIQLITEGSYLLPLPWRLSLVTRARGGVTFLNDPLGDLPASLRFFAGGDQSVRGYSYQSLGPRDASGRVIGGRNLLVGSVELERALFENWGVSLFYDAGNSFNALTNIRLSQGAGAGVRYFTPLGALSLYLARQVGVDEPGFRIHFTVGFQL
ncbi:MAG: autotransporter assembly complex protein TamA [Geobacteraceae bacterium]|nr:autotransporter assembly complex protein TamA [Geobacteraceae bacterium]